MPPLDPSPARPASGSSWQRVLAILFFAQMVTAIGFSSIFPFLSLYVKSLGAVTPLGTELLSGLVFTSTSLTMMIASPFWGKMADRHGRKLMVERSMFGGALVLVTMAWVRSAEELVALRAIQGLVTGTIGATNALMAASAPRQRTGYAMGMMYVSLGAGTALGPMLGGAIADAYGYPAAFYVTAALLVVAGLIVWVGIQENFTAPAKAAAKPRGFWQDWQRIMAVPGVLTIYSLRFIDQLGRMIFIPILPLFIEQLVHNAARLNSLTGLAIGATAGTAALSAVGLGRLGDRIGHRPILIGSCLGCGLIFVLQSLVNRSWQLLVLQALAGVAVGGIVPGISALLARYAPPGEEGAVYGLDNAIMSAARVLAPMLGVAIAAWLNYRAVLGATALLYLLGVVLALAGLPRPTATASTEPAAPAPAKID